MSWTNLAAAARIGLTNGKTSIIAKLVDIVEGDDLIQAAFGGATIAQTSVTWKATDEDMAVIKAALAESQKKVTILAQELELLRMDAPSQRWDEAAALISEPDLEEEEEEEEDEDP